MATLVYSTADDVSLGVAEQLKEIMGFEEDGEREGHRTFKWDDTLMVESDVMLFKADGLDRLFDGPLIFISMHASASGVGSFTAHATGNWSGSAEFGGEPMKLSVASPGTMLSVLCSIGALARGAATYEATHHGPCTEKPSLFVELGGNPGFASSGENRKTLARAIANSMESGFKPEIKTAAIGICGTHYPGKLTKLALEKGYAFGHMMPNYALNIGMLDQAVERSDTEMERAVIEWKGLNAADREKVIRRLEELGIDHERV